MAGSRGELPAGLIFMKKKQWRAIRPIVSPTFSIKKLKMVNEQYILMYSACVCVCVCDYCNMSSSRCHHSLREVVSH